MSKVPTKSNNPNEVLSNYLKANAADHFNFDEPINFVVSSGSLALDVEIAGGFRPGVHRLTGVSSGGKTSETLQIMKNFFATVPNSRGFYVRSGGRLNEFMQKRSGINFTTDSSAWEDGTCFIFDCNIYESVLDLIRNLCVDNPENKRYFFVIDSVDSLISREDVARPTFAEANRVGGGALLSTKFLQAMSLLLTRKGHLTVLISQVRETIQASKWEKKSPKLGNFSGGHAMVHHANLILEFQQRYAGDLILTGEKVSAAESANQLGHYCKVVIDKPDGSEKSKVMVKYPIRYGRTDGNSIWREREIAEHLLTWGGLTQKGAWYYFADSLLEELKEKAQISIDPKYQGMTNIYQLLEDNPNLTNYLYEKFRKILVDAIK